jgi:hypothetical protein
MFLLGIIPWFNLSTINPGLDPLFYKKTLLTLIIDRELYSGLTVGILNLVFD